MNSKKVKEIFKFSLYKNLQNKWFIIFNVITLVGIIIAVNWGSIASIFSFGDEDKNFHISILDNENILYDTFLNDLSGDTKYSINRIDANNYTAESIPDDLMVIEISGDAEECFKVAIISKEGINVNIYNPIKDELFKIRNKLFSKKYEIDDESLDILQRDLSINRVMLSVEASDSTTKEMVKLFSSALTYIITVFIFSKMANDIASEKQSKAIEYILTTVSEKEYLFAKIFSSIVVLIIQGLFVLIYYFIAALIMNITKTVSTDFSITASILSNFFNKDIIYYILGLFVYNVLTLILLCIIQATLASKASSTSEAGNTVSILLFVMLAAYMSTVFFLAPYEKVSMILYIISCIPILSAYFVPGMMVIGQATPMQIVISLIALIVAIPLTFKYCAPIFKNGILDYTKVKSIKKKEKSKEEIQKEYLNKREMRNLGFVIGISIIIYVGMQTIFSLIGNAALSAAFGEFLGETDITMLLQILLQVVSLGTAATFVFCYIVEKNDRIVKRQVSSKNKLKIVLIALLLIFVLQILLSVLLYPLLGLDYDTTDLFNVNSESSLISKIILVIALAVTPGFFEELFFRKAIVNFSLKYGKVFALLFSAVLFGMSHMNLSQGLFAFIMGLILGGIYLYTGDIKLTMLIHFLNNGYAALALILPEIGIIAISALLLIAMIISLGILIKAIANKSIRKKIIDLCMIKVDLKSFDEKYKYIFTDYAFDISLVLIFFMSIMTEKILR